MVPLAALSLFPAPAQVADGGPGELVFSLRTWEGKYTSRDVPGGVETTPSQSTIWAVCADGSGLRRIVQLGPVADAPAFSPDGQWLYFQSNDTGHWRMYRCRPDGAEVTCVAAGERVGEQWLDAYGFRGSRDGSRMVFTVHDGSTGHVVISNADGSDARLVAPDLGYTYMADLSPAGDRVVFSGPAREYRLLLAELPDGPVRELTPDHPESFVPRFTPDGQTIVFVRRDGDVYRVEADGSDLRRLTTGNDYVEFRLSPQDQHGSTDGPDVSPDGRQIAYLARRDGVPNVWVMDLDGGNQRQVTFRTTPCGRVRWSPDGRALAFVSFEGQYPQLFVVPAEGGEPRRLTDVPGAVYFPNWRP